jgi:hypothetical protein
LSSDTSMTSEPPTSTATSTTTTTSACDLNTCKNTTHTLYNCDCKTKDEAKVWYKISPFLVLLLNFSSENCC